MFLRILKQSFTKAKKQKKLALLTIFLASLLISSLLNISIDIGDKMANELKAYGANINIVPKGEDLSLEIGGVNYNLLKGKSFLEEKDLAKIKDIFWRNNIMGFAPFLKTKVKIKRLKEVYLIGTYFEKNVPVPDEEDFITGVNTVFPYWGIEGKRPKENSNEVLIGYTLAKENNINIGDTLSIKNIKTNEEDSIIVVGILKNSSIADKNIVANLSLAQKSSKLIGKVQSISVSALTIPENALSKKARKDTDALNSLEYDKWYCSAYVSSIAYQISENMPNSIVNPIWKIASSEGKIIKKIQLLMLIITLATLISSCMGISSFMSTSIIERSSEIGLMKALGADIKKIYLMFLTEIIIIAIIGSFFGFIFGIFLSQLIGFTIFSSFIKIKFIVLPISLAISSIISLLASFIPFKMIKSLSPTEVLYERK